MGVSLPERRRKGKKLRRGRLERQAHLLGKRPVNSRSLKRLKYKHVIDGDLIPRSKRLREKEIKKML